MSPVDIGAAGVRGGSGLPRLDDDRSRRRALEIAVSIEPRHDDGVVPEDARVAVFAEAILLYGSIVDAERHDALRVVWRHLLAGYVSWGDDPASLFSFPAVKAHINTATFRSEAAQYRAWRILRRIGRNASPESWWTPTRPRRSPRPRYRPYDHHELGYFERLAETLSDVHRCRYLAVFHLAVGFGLSSADVAVAHAAECRTEHGPVRIHTTLGPSRLIPADTDYAAPLRSIIEDRDGQYLVDTAAAIPNPAIVRAILRPVDLVRAGAKLPTVARLAATWRYRRLMCGVSVPAITYLSGRRTHSWLHDIDGMAPSITDHDFAAAQLAPDHEQLTLPFWTSQPNDPRVAG